MSDPGTSQAHIIRSAAASSLASKRLRPKDAASLILIDRSGGDFRILMGKRSSSHAFMPDTYVFPGGRRDAADIRARVSQDLNGAVVEKLLVRAPKSTSMAQVRALAVASVRETLEETGLAIGPVLPGNAGAGPMLAPDLSRLRYIARAVTPPGRSSRRYDTRFFACFVDETEVSLADLCDSSELHDLRWLTFAETQAFALPRITTIIVSELARELEHDRALPFGRPVPYHCMRYGRYVREIL